jgi:hypothetical protein
VGGIAASLAVLTRPTNILIFVPVAVALGISPRRWLLFMAGGLPGAALLVAYNRAAYGTAVTTGYGDLSQFFGLANVLPSLGNYVLWLPVLLTPIGVLALGLPSLLPKAPRLATVLMLWILAFLVFYAHYSFTHETWWYTRFLLPAFPPLIVGSLWVGSVMIERWFSRRFSARVWLAVLPALILAHNGWWGRYLGVLESGSGERTYLEAAEWARSNLPPNAAVAAMQMSGAFFYYTDFPTLRWDYLDRETLERVQSEAIAGRQPLYAALFPFDIELNAFGRLSGRWVQIARVKAATIWRFEGIADYAHTAGETPRQEWTIER